jgi:hypothetical protein
MLEISSSNKSLENFPPYMTLRRSMQKLKFFVGGGRIHEAFIFFNLIQTKVYFGINIYIDYQVLDNLYLDLKYKKNPEPSQERKPVSVILVENCYDVRALDLPYQQCQRDCQTNMQSLHSLHFIQFIYI